MRGRWCISTPDFKLMHANLFTARAALIIRHPTRSCWRTEMPSTSTRMKKKKKLSFDVTFFFLPSTFRNRFFRLFQRIREIWEEKRESAKSVEKDHWISARMIIIKGEIFDIVTRPPLWQFRGSFIETARYWWCKFTLHASCNHVSSLTTHLN